MSTSVLSAASTQIWKTRNSLCLNSSYDNPEVPSYFVVWCNYHLPKTLNFKVVAFLHTILQFIFLFLNKVCGIHGIPNITAWLRIIAACKIQLKPDTENNILVFSYNENLVYPNMLAAILEITIPYRKFFSKLKWLKESYLSCNCTLYWIQNRNHHLRKHKRHSKDRGGQILCHIWRMQKSIMSLMEG